MTISKQIISVHGSENLFQYVHDINVWILYALYVSLKKRALLIKCKLK